MICYTANNMNFELSEEQQQIKYSIREFAESEIKPHVMEWDETQHFPDELRPKLAELGLMGILFPEEYGGAGMGYVEYATIIEELGRVCGSVGLSVAAHNSLCSNHILYIRQRGTKAEISRPACERRELWCMGTDRVAGRFGCLRNADNGHPVERRLEGQRLKEFHHARHRLQHAGRRCRHRQGKRQSRHFGIHL